MEAGPGKPAVMHGGEAASPALMRKALVVGKGDAQATVLCVRRGVLERVEDRSDPDVSYALLNLYPTVEEDATRIASDVYDALHAHFKNQTPLYRPSMFVSVSNCEQLLTLVKKKVLKDGNGAANMTEADCEVVVKRLLADAKTEPTVRPCAFVA